MSWWSGERVILIIHVDGDEFTRMRLNRLHIMSLRGGDKDHATRVSSLTNEEPLVVVELCVDVMWEVIR